MSIQLKRATIADSEIIHEMQIAAYKPLLDKYEDYDTNPAAETLERVKERFRINAIDHYLICAEDENVGYLRVIRYDENTYGLSSVLILPKFQGNGYAQATMSQIELMYPPARKWLLRTIKQEPKLCHLYEKMGYKQTGTAGSIKSGMDLVHYEKNL